MANIGSAFLGDLQAKRIRHLSSPTSSTSPPASPPANAIYNSNQMSTIQSLSPQSKSPSQSPQGGDQPNQPWAALGLPPNKATIDPILALELRVRWLETLVLGIGAPSSAAGANADGKAIAKDEKGRGALRSIKNKRTDKQKEREQGKGKETATALTRLTEDVKKRLDAIVETNEGLRKFMDNYDQHAQYLTPTFALSGVMDAPLPSTPTSEDADGNKNLSPSLLPVFEHMSPQEFEAYLTEMEPDVRAADRDMREIEALVGKGVAGAGKLGDYEALKPRLTKLKKEHEEDLRLAAELEKRVAKLVERHVTHVDALSELFVAWDDTLLEAESRTNKLEKDARERHRLGLEP
ncbi:hypothetical protein P691DRAFT_801916 [Macrolepiota fuliginosa MF-IS2]|uniref:Uncharacterized protein n=1 Tax=Macrolepiota fuliginosa MF-IS2 TaxID=1400762 RepID=A0A9P6C1F9_9AGAR|nr:hypothetical protein P691DRAFT_801916 [Macrolepiota fuliginosa MF-IS2]